MFDIFWIKSGNVNRLMKSLKNLRPYSCWIERIRQTWKNEKISGLYFEKSITHEVLKQAMKNANGRFSDEKISNEVVKKYLIMLHTLYLYDNPEMTTADFKEALGEAGIHASSLNFLNKFNPAPLGDGKDDVKNTIKNYSSSLRKEYAALITELLDKEYNREQKEYVTRHKDIYKLLCKCSDKSYEEIFKKIYKKMSFDDKNKVVQGFSIISNVATDVGNTEYQKAANIIYGWIRRAN